jgi:hypothetical protein
LSTAVLPWSACPAKTVDTHRAPRVKSWLLLAVTGVGIACSSAHPAPATPNGEAAGSEFTAPAAGAPPATFDAAHEYVVAPGLRWLVVAKPSALVPKLEALFPTFLPLQRRAAFDCATGVTLETTASAAIAGYDYSTLYVARTRSAAAAELPLTRFRAHLTDLPLRRDVLGLALYSGIRDETPEHYAKLDAYTHAWAEGDPSTLKAAMLRAQKRLTETRPALTGASLSLLPSECHTGDLTVYVAGPLSPTSVANLPSAVLGRLLAASLGITLGTDAMQINGCIVGDWEDDGKQRVESLLAAIENHRFTSLLELTDEERSAIVHQADATVHFSYTLRASHALQRIHAILELDLDALLRGPPINAPGATPP